MLEATPPGKLPQKIFGDKAYDSQGLQHHVAWEWQIELSASFRNFNNQVLEDFPKESLWQKNRWKIERFFAWLKGFRRLSARWEYHPENFLSWIFLAASMILFFML